MPIEIELPDGSVVEFPDGTDNATMEQALASYASAQKPDFSGVHNAGGARTVADDSANPTAGMSGVDKFRAGMGKSFVDSARGLGQAAIEHVNTPATLARRLGADVPESFIDRTSSSLRNDATEAAQRDAPLMDTGAGLAGNVSGYASQVILPGAALRGTAGARVFLPASITGNAAQGATLGALQPVGEGESRLENAALGGAFGGGGAGVARVLGASANRARGAISEAARETWQLAQQHGIRLTAPQLSDNRFLKALQSQLRSAPLTGAKGRYDAQVAQFNRAVAGTIGENADVVTPAVYDQARRRIGGEFDRLTAQNALPVDPALIGRLRGIQQEADDLAGPEAGRSVGNALTRLVDQAPNSVLPGRAYQSLDSQIGGIARAGGERGYYLGQFQNALREAMGNAIRPEDQADWAVARGQYRDLKTLRDLVAKSGGEPISPAALQGRVAANNAGKESMARGSRGALGELAQVGQRIKEPPSSGTSERLLAGGFLNPANWPAQAAGAIVGNPLSRFLDSDLLVNIVMRENPGITRDAAAEMVRRASTAGGQSRIAQGQATPAPSPLAAQVAR